MIFFLMFLLSLSLLFISSTYIFFSYGCILYFTSIFLFDFVFTVKIALKGNLKVETRKETRLVTRIIIIIIIIIIGPEAPTSQWPDMEK